MEARARGTKGEHPGISPDRGSKATPFLDQNKVTELGAKSGPKWCRNRCQKAYQINFKTGIKKYNENLQESLPFFSLKCKNM